MYFPSLVGLIENVPGLSISTVMLLMISFRRWNEVQWVILSWFSSPVQVFLTLGAIAAVILTMKASLQKAWMLRTLIGFAFAYLLIISPVGAKLLVKGLNLFLPRDDGQPADAIVILGRGNLLEQERNQRASKIWHNRRAPIILATGNTNAPQFVQQLLMDGIPREALVEESCSFTTEENALRSAPLLQEKGVRRIILVTDSPHMLRSVLTFRSFGFRVIPEPIPLPTDYPPIVASRTTIREYIGLIGYGLTGRFNLRPNTPSQSDLLTTSICANQ